MRTRQSLCEGHTSERKDGRITQKRRKKKRTRTLENDDTCRDKSRLRCVENRRKKREGEPIDACTDFFCGFVPLCYSPYLSQSTRPHACRRSESPRLHHILRRFILVTLLTPPLLRDHYPPCPEGTNPSPPLYTLSCDSPSTRRRSVIASLFRGKHCVLRPGFCRDANAMVT